MIASLAMYDRPEMHAANDRFWALIRDALRSRGIYAPAGLTRGDDAYWATWESPDLVLSQTCGLPFRAKLHDRVTLVCTPDYGVEGCPPGYYRSVFVVRKDDARSFPDDFSQADFAFNEGLSQSGWAAVKAWFDARNLPLSPRLRTGSHAASAQAVVDGKADFAALDAVTWELLSSATDWAKDLRVVGLSDPTPGLPYITARGNDASLYRGAVEAAFDGLSQDDRRVLRLRGITFIPETAYLALPIPAAPDQNEQTF